ncbi:MAG: Crp/Fnr family transcriptional regulator [Acidobacteria bacterium]|nr:Crp/Fnr family transcriptional regulator [Acidobacteriota bacterium]
MLKALGTQEYSENRLLRSLSAEERVRLCSSIKRVTLALGQVVYECGERIDYVYFPTTCVVSLLYTTRDGATAEIALTGNDGIIGVALFLGGGNIPHRAVAQIGGHALKMPARVLQEEFMRGGPLQHILLRYTQALITQISQTAVCNRLHPLEQRLCRWLLLCHDRLDGSEILMTQEFIANMLGGRRESVTVAAGRLQDAGLIHYSRGHIRVLDREGLETMACECYKIVSDELNRLVGAPQRNEIKKKALYREADGEAL